MFFEAKPIGAKLHAAGDHRNLAGLDIDAADLGGEPKPTLLWHPAVGIIEMLIEYRARDHWTASFNRNGGCGSAGPRAARGSFAAAPTHSSRRHRPSRRPRACRSRTSTSPAPPTRTDTSNTACRDKCT